MFKCEYGKPMNSMTTFKIGGPVFCFIEAVNYKGLLKAIDMAKKEHKDIRVIGNGSNVLFSDEGFDGIVIKLGEDFNYIERHEDLLKVGSAVAMSKLIGQCRGLALTGCEFLLGIPGSFGGAVFMNAGVRNPEDNKGRIEIKDIIEEVEVLDIKDKKRKILKRQDIPFNYRSSGLLEKIVLNAAIKLEQGNEKEIDDKINSFHERRIWMNKLFYPSAGSVFKNPDTGESAGSLIEDCGLKGYSIGGALISEEHANFIVNRGGASSRDVLELIELAKKSVKERFNIDLELELRIIGPGNIPKRVGILMGGPSPESDVSIRSGEAVYKALIKKGIDAVSLKLDKMDNEVDYEEAVREKIRDSNIDTAFIALHGEFGEDGRIQKILEGMKIPYTGSKVYASRIGMDKVESKEIFKSNNILTPRYKKISKDAIEKDISWCVEELGLPIVIKPHDKGSSIGLYIVDRIEDIDSALKAAFKHSNKVILEEYIKGREITVGILADTPLPIVEIVPKNKFFDFDAKYKKGFTEYISPAKIDDSVYAECQNVALKAHKALGARFFSRVDLILSEDNTPYVLEVNTVPGLTETSLLPKAANEAGIDFEGLTLKILESATW